MEPYKWSRSMHIHYIVPSASLAQCAAMYCCIKSLPQVRAQVLFHVSPRQTRGLQVLTRAAAANNELPPPDVRKLAQLAQLSVTDEEVGHRCYSMLMFGTVRLTKHVANRCKSGNLSCRAYWAGAYTGHACNVTSIRTLNKLVQLTQVCPATASRCKRG